MVPKWDQNVKRKPEIRRTQIENTPKIKRVSYVQGQNKNSVKGKLKKGGTDLYIHGYQIQQDTSHWCTEKFRLWMKGHLLVVCICIQTQTYTGRLATSTTGTLPSLAFRNSLNAERIQSATGVPISKNKSNRHGDKHVKPEIQRPNSRENDEHPIMVWRGHMKCVHKSLINNKVRVVLPKQSEWIPYTSQWNLDVTYRMKFTGQTTYTYIYIYSVLSIWMSEQNFPVSQLLPPVRYTYLVQPCPNIPIVVHSELVCHTKI